MKGLMFCHHSLSMVTVIPSALGVVLPVPTMASQASPSETFKVPFNSGRVGENDVVWRDVRGRGFLFEDGSSDIFSLFDRGRSIACRSGPLWGQVGIAIWGFLAHKLI